MRDDRRRRRAAPARTPTSREQAHHPPERLVERGPVLEVERAPDPLARRRPARSPQAPAQTASFQASTWCSAGTSRNGSVSTSSRWSKSPLRVLGDPLPLLVVDHRARALAEHAALARVEHEQPHAAEVAAEAPAAAVAAVVGRAARSRAAAGPRRSPSRTCPQQLVLARAPRGERLPRCW